MESCYPRDFLCRLGKNESFRESTMSAMVSGEEVELSLGLSLGGRFGLEPKGKKLARSSSLAAETAYIALEVAAAPLARTSSLPADTEEERRKRREMQSMKRQDVMRRRLERRNSMGHGGIAEGSAETKPELDLMSVPHDNGGECALQDGGVMPVAAPTATSVKLQGSRSSSSASSDGEGQKVEVNVVDTLVRTSSLPAEIEEEWRKRKELQSLKRLEVKRKRLERRNSLTSNTTKEAGGQTLEEVKFPRIEKAESCHDIVGVKQTGRSVSIDLGKLADGLLPTSEVVFKSQGRNFLGMSDAQSQPLQGTTAFSGSITPAGAQNPSAVQPLAKHARERIVAALPPLAAGLASNCPRGEQNFSRRVAARTKSMGDVERIMMQEMPCVSTKGLGPNGKRVEGFLYKYRKGEEVRIVCVCHGSFLTPAEFVKHAGGGDVAHPERHIVINPIPSAFL